MLQRACAVGVLLHMAYFAAARCSLRILATYGVLRCCPLRYITVARYGVLRYCPLLYTSLATYGVLRCCPLLYMRVARCIWRSTVLPTAVYECCYIRRTTVLPTTLYEGCYMHMVYYGAAHCSIRVCYIWHPMVLPTALYKCCYINAPTPPPPHKFAN